MALSTGLLAICLLGQVTTVRFAVIGDYGKDGSAESSVAAMVRGWSPDFVVTAGDNNYETGSASTIDANIGKHYHDYIYNYTGSYGSGSATLRFLPCPGNHDWGNVLNNPNGLNPYLAYFTLPGNERYYSFRKGPVELFLLDSDQNEADGVTSGSIQGQWCRAAMLGSGATWKIPVFHHAAYSSGAHGSTAYMRWPFESWGASAVLAGHDHIYERLQVGNIPYFVDGLGGRSLYAFGTILPESRVRYNADYGAMLVTATRFRASFQFFNRQGVLIDQWTLVARPETIGPIPL